MKKETDRIFHCFFEQSGTFKNEFKKLGYQAYDYDILNDFNETDYQIDLFKEIKNAYDGKPNLFDSFNKSKDTILAFFPCIRFEEQIQLYFRGTAMSQKKWSDEKKLEYNLKLHLELHDLYEIITKLTIVCIRKKIPLIIENPYSTNHYLVKYWCIPYTKLDTDRSLNGDYYVKPTQYWFINCIPKENFIFEPLQLVPQKKITGKVCDGGVNNTAERSMIHPQYASRFIREFIIDEKKK